MGNGFDMTRKLKEMRDAIEITTGERGPFCLVGDSATLNGLAKQVIAEHVPLVFPDHSGCPDNLMGLLLVPADGLDLPPGSVSCVPLSRLVSWVKASVLHMCETARFPIQWS